MDSVTQQQAVSPMRRYRSVSDKRRIVGRVVDEGLSVAQIAREEGINANQLHRWRREYQAGLLAAEDFSACRMLEFEVENAHVEPLDLPVSREEADAYTHTTMLGSIHIDIEHGRASIIAECGADQALLRIALEALRR